MCMRIMGLFLHIVRDIHFFSEHVRYSHYYLVWPNGPFTFYAG